MNDINQIALNKNDPESIYNFIAYKISCPEFRSIIKDFIDKNCSTFIDIEENSHEQGKIFNEFNEMIEKLLNNILLECQINESEFLKIFEKGKKDKIYHKYFRQIQNFQNYNFFKAVMVKRNIQLVSQAEKELFKKEKIKMQSNNFINNKNQNEINQKEQNKNIIDDKIISVIFKSTDGKVNYTIQCKKSDKFYKIEDLLYDEYPEFRDSENVFLANGSKIRRFRTLEENTIKNNNILLLMKNEE